MRMVSTKKAASMPTAPSASFHALRQSLSSDEDMISSADVDSDEDAEQRLGGEVDDNIANDFDDGEFLVGDGPDRWQGLLASTGLEGKLRHADLPETRKVSTFDIFCNRELKMDNVVAVGFDMVSRQSIGRCLSGSSAALCLRRRFVVSSLHFLKGLYTSSLSTTGI